jgi:hypothetical protein
MKRIHFEPEKDGFYDRICKKTEEYICFRESAGLIT